ncbi:MAG: hypothetical protein V3V33_08835 [Candidatus Lokiarchaeia archaeon]
MIYIKNKTKTSLLSLILLGIIMCGVLFTTALASSNYQSTLVKGTDIFTVSEYNDAVWKTTVNNSTNPSNWFEGETNITGAKSKITMKGWRDTTWETYDVLTGIFITEFFSLEEIYPLLALMNNLGYNETTINANYTNNYKISYGVRSVWNFTSSDYPDEQSYTDGIKVFKNPLDFKSMLDDYSNLSAELNEKLFFTPFSFPSLNADEFLWNLALNGLAIAKPQSEYLEDLIDELGCENVTSSGSTLIFERYGETEYTVEILYGNEGTISSLLVKDVDDNIIFRIVSKNSDWIFYITLIVLAVCGVVLVAYIIVKKRKPKI